MKSYTKIIKATYFVILIKIETSQMNSSEVTLLITGGIIKETIAKERNFDVKKIWKN